LEGHFVISESRWPMSSRPCLRTVTITSSDAEGVWNRSGVADPRDETCPLRISDPEDQHVALASVGDHGTGQLIRIAGPRHRQEPARGNLVVGGAEAGVHQRAGQQQRDGE
jgi:hypothetical protein